MTQTSSATHEVFNQSPPFEDVDLFALDRPLVDAVAAKKCSTAMAIGDSHARLLPGRVSLSAIAHERN